MKDVEIVGEAASRPSEAFRAEHPELPWKAIVAMRNRLVHAYFDIDREIVWNTVAMDLPPLITAVETLLEAPDS